MDINFNKFCRNFEVFHINNKELKIRALEIWGFFPFNLNLCSNI